MTVIFRKKYYLSSLLALLLGASCTPMMATDVAVPAEGKLSNPEPSTPAPTPTPAPIPQKPDFSCLIDKPDYNMKFKVNRFEMTDSGGVNVGFNLLSGLFQAIGLNVDYATGTLNTSLSLFEAFKPVNSVVDAEGQSSHEKMNFGANFSAGIAGGGFNYYSQTPVYDLSGDAIKNNLENALAMLSKKQEDWSTHILEVKSDREFLIPTGTSAGIQVGDELKVIVATYDWIGEPCKSNLRIAIRYPDQVIATAVVKQVNQDTAYLVADGTPTVALEQYAMVVISKLVSKDPKKPRKTLARSVGVDSVTAMPLQMSGKNGVETVELAPLLKEQIKVILRQSPFADSFYMKN